MCEVTLIRLYAGVTGRLIRYSRFLFCFHNLHLFKMPEWFWLINRFPQFPRLIFNLFYNNDLFFYWLKKHMRDASFWVVERLGMFSGFKEGFVCFCSKNDIKRYQNSEWNFNNVNNRGICLPLLTGICVL